MAKGKRKHDGKESGGKKPLDGSPSHLLHRVLQVALDVYAEETGPGALTQRQFAVLAAVADNEGLTQTDLVHATGIDRSTLADLVARMLGKGLLERERSATDGRANTVRLAAAGRDALTAARPRVEAADKRILSLLPGGKRGALMKVLGDLARAGEAAKDATSDKAARKAEKARKKAEKKAKPKKAKAEKPVKPARAAKPANAPKPAKPAKAAKAKKPLRAPKAAKPAKAKKPPAKPA
jgi:DNA-binding MarR family transcriptional regulator